jgi:hypothetical protein
MHLFLLHYLNLDFVNIAWNDNIHATVSNKKQVLVHIRNWVQGNRVRPSILKEVNPLSDGQEGVTWDCAGFEAPVAFAVCVRSTFFVSPTLYMFLRFSVDKFEKENKSCSGQTRLKSTRVYEFLRQYVGFA